MGLSIYCDKFCVDMSYSGFAEWQREWIRVAIKYLDTCKDVPDGKIETEGKHPRDALKGFITEQKLWSKEDDEDDLDTTTNSCIKAARDDLAQWIKEDRIDSRYMIKHDPAHLIAVGLHGLSVFVHNTSCDGFLTSGQAADILDTYMRLGLNDDSQFRELLEFSVKNRRLIRMS